MKREAWFARLGEQCPGWHVWYSSPGGWFGSPVTPPVGQEARLAAFFHPNRLGPYRTPQELREGMRERYAAGEHCDTCGAPWELCGHRQPESRVAP